MIKNNSTKFLIDSLIEIKKELENRGTGNSLFLVLSERALNCISRYYELPREIINIFPLEVLKDLNTSEFGIKVRDEIQEVIKREEL